MSGVAVLDGGEDDARGTGHAVGAGLFAMSLAMPFTLSLFEKEFENLVETILSLLKGLGHG